MAQHKDRITLDNIIFEAVVGEYPIGIYKTLIYIKVINILIFIFLSAFIATEGAKNTYFIKDKVMITIFIFIINEYNY